jgi:UDP-N-acetylglucosamine acyltransferase
MKYNVGMANKIHPTALIGPHVELGSNNIIGPGAVVIGPCEIGDGNWIGPYAVIGTPAEYQGVSHPESWNSGSDGFVKIGSGNTFREFVTLQVAPGTTTLVASNCYFMTKSHIPHDAVIEDEVKVACAALIGGFGHIGKGSYIGLGAIIHQRIHIGQGSMVGMGSVVTNHVPPLSKFFGSPARLRGGNLLKFAEFGVSEKNSRLLIDSYSDGQIPDLGNADHELNLLFASYVNAISK